MGLSNADNDNSDPEFDSWCNFLNLFSKAFLNPSVETRRKKGYKI